jgi:glycosyltransferase involved in cell wall biosynthesis
MMPTLEQALFITPVMPAARGIGPAQRARLFFDALRGDYHVHLVAVPVLGDPPATGELENMAGLCSRVDILRPGFNEDAAFAAIAGIADADDRLRARLAYPWPQLGRFARKDVAALLARTLAGCEFAVIHVFRLYLAPLIAGLVAGDERPRLQLDLDDYESQTHDRFAEEYERAGAADAAMFERAEARKYGWWEDAFLPRFDRVFVCSEDDRERLSTRFASDRFAVVPNAVAIPSAATFGNRSSRNDGAFTLLFVGTLGYAPNLEAVRWFSASVLPRVQEALARPVRLVVVGPGGEHLKDVFGPSVTASGWVDDLASEYAAADVVVVPIRAGGGTRIKILEAFAHRVPVVATCAAAEGIAAEPDTHFLAADDEAAFADACVLLARAPERRAALAERAFDLVARDYDARNVRERIRQLSVA